jgi:hypothetical protein
MLVRALFLTVALCAFAVCASGQNVVYTQGSVGSTGEHHPDTFAKHIPDVVPPA